MSNFSRGNFGQEKYRPDRFSEGLKELPGTIELEPVSDKDSVYYALLNDGEKEFKPYYVAHTKIETLALLDEKDQGSNWHKWWRRLQPIRTGEQLNITGMEIAANHSLPSSKSSGRLRCI